MKAPQFNNFEILRGQALDIDITVPVEADLSAATVEFGLSTSADAAYTDTINTTKAGQIITAEIDSVTSAGLTADTYYYSCWINITGDYTPVARGYITVKDDSRTA